MKPLLIKIFVVCLIAAICGVIAGVVFSIWFYGLIPRPWHAEVIASDTPAKAWLRFWLAFAVGAVGGAVWSYRIVKDLEL